MFKLITGVLVVSIFTSSTGFLAAKQEPIADVKYIVAVGWEQAKPGGKNQPLVTNVFHFECETNYGIVESQLKEHYNAYYKSNRGTMYMKDEIEFSYDSRAEAEIKRTQMIAKYKNNGNDVLLIDKFSVACED